MEKNFPEKGNIEIVTTASDDNRSYHINSDKIKAIGFSPKVTLDDVISGALKGLQERKKENDAHFYPERHWLRRFVKAVLG